MLNYTPQTQEGQELREVYSFLRETARKSQIYVAIAETVRAARPVLGVLFRAAEALG